MATTLKEIALACGTSVSSVSRILRGLDQVSPKTRKRVLDAARRLKYQPNLLVRGMQTGRSGLIGVLSDLDDYGVEVMRGITERLGEDTSMPIYQATDKHTDGYKGRTEREQIQHLIGMRIDGLIMRPVEDEADSDHVREIREHNLPTVLFDREFDNLRMDFVGTDDREGGRAAARHLLESGHRALGHIAGPDFARTGRLRRKGFEEAVARKRGATCRTHVDPTFSRGADQFARLMESTPRPTAVFAANDYQAAEAMVRARTMGLRVPEDVSILGFGALPFGRLCSPALSTFDQRAHHIGRTAADVLMKRVKKESPARRIRIEVPAVLIQRESTARVPDSSR